MAKLRSIPVLALCAIYIFLAAGVALLSSSAYRAVEEAAGTNSRQRVALSYVISQLRAGDTIDAIRIVQFGDGDALSIIDRDTFPDAVSAANNNIEDARYETLLYCYDGYLMELYAERDLGLEPSAGMKIAEAQSFAISAEGSLLTLCIVDRDGKTSQTDYLIRSGEVVA